MTGYAGPQSIPAEMAENLMEALNPILDILATQPVDWIGRRTRSRKVDENRWILWRAVNIARESLLCNRSFRNPWPDSPAQKRYMNSLAHLASPYHLTCDRPTKKGTPCRLRLSKGRAHCWLHSTEEENDELSWWQNAVHLPYPRIGKTTEMEHEELVEMAIGMMRELL